MVKFKNLFQALKEQLPIKRAFHNFFITGNAWGMFSKLSHTKADGVDKLILSKKSAVKAAEKMSAKNKVHYSVYKCIYCDGYHIGRINKTKEVLSKT